MALKMQRKRKALFRAWHAKQIGKNGRRRATPAFHTPTYWKRRAQAKADEVALRVFDITHPVEVADVDIADFGKDGNFGWVGSFTDPDGVVQTAYSDNTPFRVTGVTTLDALDEANNGQVSRLLKGDGTHRHMAEVITNLGFHTTESSIRRYRKKIEA